MARRNRSWLGCLFLTAALSGAARGGPGQRLPFQLNLDPTRFPPISTEGLRVIEDVSYYDGEDADPRKHKLDLYLPKEAKGAPVVVFVHGGGWISGDRKTRGDLYANVGTAYAHAGIGCACISYRLSPRVKHPAHAQDVARTLRWVHDHIAEYGGDPTKVVLSGHSAGGHLAALVTLDTRYVEEVGLPEDFLKGAIPMSGVYDVARMNRLNFSRKLFLEPAFGVDETVWKDASPLNHVRAEAPPFFLVNAQHDFTLLDDARRFGDALKEAGVSVETYVAPETNHGTVIGLVGREGDATTPKLIEFVKKVVA